MEEIWENVVNDSSEYLVYWLQDKFYGVASKDDIQRFVRFITANIINGNELSTHFFYENDFLGIDSAEAAKIQNLGFTILTTHEIGQKYYEIKKSRFVIGFTHHICIQLNLLSFKKDIERFVENLVSNYSICNLPASYALFAPRQIGKYRKLLKDQFGWSEKNITKIDKNFIAISEEQIMYMKLLQTPYINCEQVIDNFNDFMNEIDE